MAAPEPDQPKQQDAQKPKPPALRSSLMIVMAFLLLLWLWQGLVPQLSTYTIRYNQFKAFVARGEVAKCVVLVDEIRGEIAAAPEVSWLEKLLATVEGSGGGEPDRAAPETPTPTEAEAARPSRPAETDGGIVLPNGAFAFRTVRVVDDPKLVEQLEAAGIEFTGERPSVISQLFWGWILPVFVLVLLFMLLFRRPGGAGGPSLLSMGKTRAKLIAERESDVSFEDVAGCEEAKQELEEVVDFLRNPDRYRALGARIPTGVLLVGPPGTGKTLLARAVAGEAEVPFFSLSGSDFVEMFVGVGAARVRDLFEKAKQKAPCIIFIDELDAVGRQRGVHVGVVNDEREQTLNALLVEMDGFEANQGVILLSATNRPDVLDRALLRPGRFDRQVVVDAPDLDGRQAILVVHTRRVPLADDVDLRVVARATPGFSGADLANAVNEAALLAARRHGKTIEQRDLEEAVEKVVAGPERKSRRLLEDEKRRVAFHEVGHALVAYHSPTADPVRKISIVPRGKAALGYTLQLPEDNQFLMTRDQLVDRIKGLLGGRAAEEVVFGQVSTGAANDLERATDLARQMVCSFGMGESVGLAHCGREIGVYHLEPDAPVQLDCSPDTAKQIDDEVRGILDSAYQKSRNILTEHRDQLDRVAKALLETETLDEETFVALLNGEAGG